MITCPFCQHKEPLGALFCGHCGADLSSDVDMPTKNVSRPSIVGDASRKPPRGAPGFPEAMISLNILDRGYILPLAGREEYTLGRVSKGQSVLPDIDLSPFDAYKAGVSRLHATLKIQGKNITVTDLGSSNGTYINGKTIPAHTPQPLRHGDILALGKLKIQILFGQTR